MLTERTVFKEIAEENKSLRKALGLNMPKEERLLLTDIVGYGSQNIGQYVFIDKGRADGLKNGLMVIGGNGGLIGKIIEADDHFSKVLLITDYASNINAVVQNTERSQGLVKGQHGLTLVMEMLPLEDKIEVGQSVVSVGSVDLSPPGLLIGRVQKVILRENDVFQKALIGPAVDFRRLEKAFVVIIN